MAESSNQQYWSPVEIFTILGFEALGEDPAGNLRKACDNLIASEKCSKDHVNGVLLPIRDAIDPVAKYRAGLKTIQVGGTFKAVTH